MTDFLALINDVTNYFEESAKTRRKSANDAKKRAYKTLTKQMADARLCLASELLTEKQVSDFLKYDYDSFEIDVDNAHKIRATFGDYELTAEKEIHSAEKKLVKVYVKFKNDYNGPRWYVVCPITEDSPCRIETYTHTSTNLVCDVPQK